MASAEEELIRIMMEIKGADALKDLHSKLDMVNDEINQLVVTTKNLGTVDQATADKVRQLATEKAKLTSQIDRYESVAKRATASTEAISRGSSKAAQSVLGMSRAFQDVAQGGIAGGLNNIEQIFVGLPGKLSQLGGPAMAVATAGFLVYQNWDNVMNLFGRRTTLPPIDTSSLDGVKDKIKEVDDALEKLRKRPSVSFEDAEKFKELQAQEKELKEQLKVKQRMEHLKEAKSEAAQDAAKGVEKALGENGPKEILDAIEKAFNDSIAARKDPGMRDDKNAPFIEAQRKQIAQFRKEYLEGNEQAYQDIIGLAGAMFGQQSKFVEDLKRFGPQHKRFQETNDNMAKVFHDAIAENHRLRDEARDLTQQGADNQADMLRDLREEGIKKFGTIWTKNLTENLVAMRAGGATVEDQTRELTTKVKSELKRLAPMLSKFPAEFEATVKEVTRKLTEDLDEAISRMAAEEGLVKEEMIRRMDHQREAHDHNKMENLAQDEMTQFFRNNNEFVRKFFPGAPEMTPQQQEQAAKDFQQHLGKIGLGVDDQVKLGRLMNNPMRAQQAPEVFQRFMNQGMDEKGSIEAMLEVFGKARVGHRINIDPAVNDQVNRMMRRDRGLFNFRQNVDARDLPDVARAAQVDQNAAGGAFKSVGLGPDPGAAAGGDAGQLNGKVARNQGGLVDAVADLGQRDAAIEMELDRVWSKLNTVRNSNMNRARR